ncbi:MAG: SH3 domain-containing protein [Candidatus Acidiferrales bacterium]
MKYFSLAIGVFFFVALPARADSVAYAHCGTYDSYILLYKSTQKFEELGKLRCGEKIEVVARNDDYTEVQTEDGRTGWVINGDLSASAPPPQEVYTFGMTEKRKSDDAQSAEIPHEQLVAARAVAAPASAPAEPAALITNVNVMKMQGDHAAPDEIIAKINSSRCDFDTTPEGIHRLKIAGVSDRIVLAMLHAPAAFPLVFADGTASAEATIPNGTSIEVAVSSDVLPSGLQEGSIVEMSVAQDVVIGGVTVVARGAEARGRVMAVRHAGLGSAGEVVWFMQDVQAASGDRIPANFAPTQDATVSVGDFAGYPFFMSEFRKNGPAIAASGDHFSAVVSGNILVRVPQPSRGEQAAQKTKVQAVRQLVPTASATPVFPAIVDAPEQQASVKP